MRVIELSDQLELLDDAVNYFYNCWGSEDNHAFYKDCIENSVNKENALPKFYVVLEDAKIIASYALLVNDVISRQDLMPWFACLYVNEEHRNKGIAGKLLEHGLSESRKRNFDHLYLSSDLKGFYEAKGWVNSDQGYNVFGDKIKIYTKPTNT